MSGMSDIVKKTAQLLCGPIFLFGVYIIFHGHLSPGGGFTGGVIIAASFLLLILSHGEDVVKLKHSKTESSLFESLSLMIVLILAIACFALGTDVFFGNYLPKGEPGQLLSAGAIPLYNVFIGIEVAAALLSIFLAFVIYKEESKTF